MAESSQPFELQEMELNQRQGQSEIRSQSESLQTRSFWDSMPESQAKASMGESLPPFILEQVRFIDLDNLSGATIEPLGSSGQEGVVFKADLNDQQIALKIFYLPKTDYQNFNDIRPHLELQRSKYSDKMNSAVLGMVGGHALAPDFVPETTVITDHGVIVGYATPWIEGDGTEMTYNYESYVQQPTADLASQAQQNLSRDGIYFDTQMGYNNKNVLLPGYRSLQSLVFPFGEKEDEALGKIKEERLDLVAEIQEIRSNGDDITQDLQDRISLLIEQMKQRTREIAAPILKKYGVENFEVDSSGSILPIKGNAVWFIDLRVDDEQKLLTALSRLQK